MAAKVPTSHYQHTRFSNVSLPLQPIPKRVQRFQDCSVKNIIDTDLTWRHTAHPLPVAEFVHRRELLAQTLSKNGIDAFAVEPGYRFSYYTNVTQKDWEVWEPEERPFLMIVQPHEDKARTTFLVPSFETERAKLLEMPFEEPIEFVTYEEHWEPYATLHGSRLFANTTDPKIMVDEELRDFISRGLSASGFSVEGLSGEVERLRQIKTDREVGILRAVNTGTVESLRAMRKCLTPGLTENDVMYVLDNAMRAAGLNPFFDIVLFDTDASNPYGGTKGIKKLREDTFVLVDVGAHLFGYSSDICRTFLPPFSKRAASLSERDSLPSDMKEKLDVWNIVSEAQAVSLGAMHENKTAADVDIAARSMIKKAGYGGAFTYRVGHGIGIKAHESPYLNKGNVNVTLKRGMAFTSEPGIYLVDKFGVRTEDVVLVTEGDPDVLSGRRATGPWDP